MPGPDGGVIDRPPLPEKIAVSPAVGAQARLLLGGEALNPKNLSLPEVRKESLGTLESRDYSLLDRSSNAERNEYYAKNSASKNDAEWVTKKEQEYTKMQDFFEKTDKGKGYKRALGKIGINTADVKNVGDQILDAVLDPLTERSDIKTFVKTVLNAYTQNGHLKYGELTADMAAFKWLSKIYGKNTSELLPQIIDAEAKLIYCPDDFIGQINQKTGDKGQTRINVLTNTEQQMLAFIWEGKKMQLPKPQEERKGIQRDIPIAHFKEDPSSLTEGYFASFLEDKGFSKEAAQMLLNQGLLAQLFDNLVIRQDSSQKTQDVVQKAVSEKIPGTARYKGAATENLGIDTSIAESGYKQGIRRQFSGRGATRLFELGGVNREKLRSLLGDTPIVVEGAGPAGIMFVKAAIELGFDPNKITWIDRMGDPGGIWNQKNVVSGSRNNPFPFNFLGTQLEAAPGPGLSIKDFLDQSMKLSDSSLSFPKPVKGIVTSVTPGDLNHTVKYKAGNQEYEVSAPIVINALGTGKPLDPNREGYMKTDTPNEGIRWQQIIRPEDAEQYRGKTLVLIGLGNSTAEMLTQIEEYNKKGYNIDYRVITHYPKESVGNPQREVVVDGKTFQVFRDIKVQNLTKWEGDMESAREAYLKALGQGKILSDIVSWHAENGKFTAVSKSGQKFEVDYPAKKGLFTLIGYGQDPESLKAMGIKVTDEYLGTVAYDYDGEIQKNPGALGRERVYAGYFGLGTVLKSKENPNALVIPGIMHRLYDQLYSVVLRAAEYKSRQLASQQKQN